MRGIAVCLRALLCLGLSLLAAPALADTYPRQPGIDALNYVFRVTLSDDTDEIVGEATIDLRFIKGSLTEFTLDLATTNGGKGMTVAEVHSGGTALRFTHQADLLRITLGSPSKTGERTQFTVKYRGVPARGLRILKNKFGERCFLARTGPTTRDSGSR